MSTKFWGRSLRQLSDYDKLQPKFIVMYDETHGYMGANYGPPDPPPQMEYETRATIVSLNSEEEVIEWIKDNQETKYGQPKKYKVFKIDPIWVRTEVSVSLGKTQTTNEDN